MNHIRVSCKHRVKRAQIFFHRLVIQFEVKSSTRLETLHPIDKGANFLAQQGCLKALQKVKPTKIGIYTMDKNLRKMVWEPGECREGSCIHKA